MAELSCGHGQHLRHDPPFVEREWVLDPRERERRLGSMLDCPGCDRAEIPEGYAPASRTREFDQDTIPEALKRDHDTKPGVWGVIHVSEGRLAYRVRPPLESHREVAAGDTAVVVPEVLHSVEALGPVRFHVEFLRRS